MNVTPLTTNRAEASALILAAHAANTLPAQNGLNGTYFARNDDGTVCRCAIGVMYPEAEARELEGDGAEASWTSYPMACALIAQGLLLVPQDEEQWFTDIQDAHDDWTIFSVAEQDSDYEQRFLALLTTPTI